MATDSAPSPGTVSIEQVGDKTWPARRGQHESIVVRHERYTWTPPTDLRLGEAPDGGRITLDAFTGTNGIRRFLPRSEEGIAGYLARAFQAGHSLLARDLEFDRDSWNRYLLSKLLFDRMQHVQERVKRRFRSAGDLQIRTTQRAGVGFDDVLPDDIGLDLQGKGQRWGVDQLITEGRAAAGTDTLRSCTEAEAIAYGLLAAARQRPLQRPTDKVSPLIRMALFDLSRSATSVSKAERDDVWQRFSRAVHSHRANEGTTFNDWFVGGHGNLVRSLANQAGGEELDVTVVRRALLDLGWQAYHVVGECVEAFAQSFAQALPDPLGTQEHAQFEAIFCQQEHFGGLPLVLLMDRSDLLKPIVLQLWDEGPSEELVGALHTVLAWHDVIASRRRETDRVAKRSIREVRVPVPEGTQQSSSDPAVQNIFRHLFELHDVTCAACAGTLHGELSDDAVQGEPLTIIARCEVHGQVDKLDILWDQFVHAAREVRDAE
ncbi:MAG TPA: hypothetical protein VGG64_11850 [Pirellulales bacterium]|jgi:hypothetical protein